VSAASDELLAVFADEASEGLELLCNEALALEGHADTDDHGERVGAMFRAAHSLKGSARLVGLGELSQVAHALEDVLSELRAGALAAGPELVTLVLRAVDLMRALLPGALNGTDQRAATEAAVQEIRAAAEVLHGLTSTPPTPPTPPTPTETAAPIPTMTPTPAEIAAPSPTPTASDVPTSAHETIKVPVARLDAIGRLVGEALAAQLGLEKLVDRRDDADVASAAVIQLGRVLQALDREAQRARMVSFGTVAGPLQRAVRDVAASGGKDVEWNLDGAQTQLDRQVLERLRDPLMHLVRNAVDHGLEPSSERVAAGKSPAGHVSVRAETRGEQVVVTVSDDGRGVDEAAVADAAQRLGVAGDPSSAMFLQGVSTASAVTEVSGRGVGLDVVQDTVERLRGQIAVRSQPGEGATFELTMPLSVASLRCLIAGIGPDRYAIPIHACARIVDDVGDLIRAVEGECAIELDGTLHPLHDLGELLASTADPAAGPAIMLRVAGRQHAIRVDELHGQRDVVVKELSRLLGASRAVAGASVEPEGTVMLVLDPAGLGELAGSGRIAARRMRGGAAAAESSRTPTRADAVSAPARVLVVDDALTVRELQRSILTRGGYEVETASDGLDAITRLGNSRPDVVISDVEMPRMDGFTLTESIREHPTLSSLPVILVTSLGDEEHRRRGLEAGADAYLDKDMFDERVLLDAVQQVLGGQP
jgi:two-component system chemotaxis sensor kinase CheA